MKKDIEWAQKEVDRYLSYEGVNEARNALVFAKGVIDQLDEPEALSQKWIDESSTNLPMSSPMTRWVSASKLQNLLVPKQEEVDRAYKDGYEKGKEHTFYKGYLEGLADKENEPEKVVVPEFVANWVEDLKSKKINLLENIYDFTHGEDIYNYIREQGDVLMRAWLDGYEVEEDPLYYALVKGHELVHDDDVYWNYDKSNHDVFVSRLHPPHDNFITEMSKSEWNRLGINDSNADFVKVDEELN